MSEANGEEFLKANGLIKNSSSQRQKLLGCLGCRWNRAEASGNDPVAYGLQIIKCNGFQSGTIYPLLQKLEAANVIISAWENVGAKAPRRALRREYSPAESYLGQAFAASLTPPDYCPLEDLAELDCYTLAASFFAAD